MAQEEDQTEKMLEAVYTALVDELRNFERGDPESIPATAQVVLAKRELDNYRKSKKKK